MAYCVAEDAGSLGGRTWEFTHMSMKVALTKFNRYIFVLHSSILSSYCLRFPRQAPSIRIYILKTKIQ